MVLTILEPGPISHLLKPLFSNLLSDINLEIYLPTSMYTTHFLISHVDRQLLSALHLDCLYQTLLFHNGTT